MVVIALLGLATLPQPAAAETGTTGTGTTGTTGSTGTTGTTGTAGSTGSGGSWDFDPDRAGVIARLVAGESSTDFAADLAKELDVAVQVASLIPSRHVFEFTVATEERRASEEMLEEVEDADHVVWAARRPESSTGATRFHAWPTTELWDEDAVTGTIVNAFDLGRVHAVAQGEGSIVAVLDSGFDVTHPLLSDNMIQGLDLVDDDLDVADVLDGVDNDGNGQIDEGYGHGTFVAGIVLEIAPQAQILPIRVLDSDGAGQSHSITEGIYVAIERGAHVINLSFGLTAGDEPKELEKALRAARGAGVVVVAAAGNTNAKDPRLLGSKQKVITVAASTGPDGVLADFSSYGKKVTVSAPGIEVVSAIPGGGVATWSGSSMAAPVVAGQAALLMALSPGSSTKEDGFVRKMIKDTTGKQSKQNGKRKTKEGPVDIVASVEKVIDKLDLDVQLPR